MEATIPFSSLNPLFTQLVADPESRQELREFFLEEGIEFGSRPSESWANLLEALEERPELVLETTGRLTKGYRRAKKAVQNASDTAKVTVLGGGVAASMALNPGGAQNLEKQGTHPNKTPAAVTTNYQPVQPSNKDMGIAVGPDGKPLKKTGKKADVKVVAQAPKAAPKEQAPKEQASKTTESLEYAVKSSELGLVSLVEFLDDAGYDIDASWPADELWEAFVDETIKYPDLVELFQDRLSTLKSI